MSNQGILILSGGMDSSVLLSWLINKKYNIECLVFNYGSKHNDRENVSAIQICNYFNVEYKIISLPFVNDLFTSDLLKSGGDIPQGHYQDTSMRKTVVPFRNGIMLSIAVGYAESKDIDSVYFGAHSGDHAIYPDCTENFYQLISKASQQGTYNKVSIHSPFNDMTKADIVKIGLDLGVPFDLTYSCYNGGEIHCGKCGTCVERLEAFELNNIKDFVKYKE